MTAIGPLANVAIMTGDGAPVDSTTGAGVLPPGSLYVDTTNANVYINSGTKAVPAFSVVSLAALSTIISSLSAAELGRIDGITPGTQAAGKAVVPNDDVNIGVVKATQLHIGATGSETQVTATGAELNYCDVTTPGTLQASKAMVTDSNSHISAVKTAALHLGATGSETQVTATAAQLNALASASAGIASVLAGGLGGSASFAKTSAATTTLIAANATKDRAVLVVVHVDEAYDIGTGTLPTVKIGEDDTVEKCMAATVLDTETAGTVLVFAFTNTATKKIIVTTTAAVGDATGGCTITAIAIPTT